MQQLIPTKSLTALYWLGLLTFGSACSDTGEREEDVRDSDAVEAAEEPVAVDKHPGLLFELMSYEGEVCPADTVEFSSGDGSFLLATSTDSSGKQGCEIHIQVTVPAGYIFKHPLISTSGAAFREEEATPPTRVAITYNMAERSLTSKHEVPGALLGSPDSESYVLVDTPDIEVQTCNVAAEPKVLDLQINVEADIPDGNVFRISSIEAEFGLGVPWYRCPTDPTKESAKFFMDETNHLPI